MGNIDLDALGIASETTVDDATTPREVPVTGGNIDLDALGITHDTREGLIQAETGVATTELQAELPPQRDIFSEFSAEDIPALQEIINQHRPEIERIFQEIDTEIESARELSEDALIIYLGNTTIVGELGVFGNTIQTEVNRIRNLPEGSQISINIPELSDGDPLIFPSKKDAYLWLYYNKYSLAKISLFVQELIQSGEVDNRLRNGGIIVAGIVGSFLILRNLQRSVGNFRAHISETEITRRRGIQSTALEVFQGDSKITRRIQALDPSKARFLIRLRNIVYGRGVVRQGVSTVFNPFYSARSRYAGFVERLETARSQRAETLQHFTQATGEGDIRNMRAYLELDHSITNQVEITRRNEFTRLYGKYITNGNLSFLYGSSSPEDAKNRVRRRLAGAILGLEPNETQMKDILSRGATLESSDVRHSPMITDITSYDEILRARQIQANLDGTPYDMNTVRGELVSFFSHIGAGDSQNRYTHYSASAVIENILNGVDQNTAISAAEGIDITQLESRSDTYISKQNSEFMKTLRRNVVARAQGISSIEELRRFEIDVMSHMRNQDGIYRPGFETIGIETEGKIEERRVIIGSVIEGTPGHIDTTPPDRINAEMVDDITGTERAPLVDTSAPDAPVLPREDSAPLRPGIMETVFPTADARARLLLEQLRRPVDGGILPDSFGLPYIDETDSHRLVLGGEPRILPDGPRVVVDETVTPPLVLGGEQRILPDDPRFIEEAPRGVSYEGVLFENGALRGEAAEIFEINMLRSILNGDGSFDEARVTEFLTRAQSFTNIDEFRGALSDLVPNGTVIEGHARLEMLRTNRIKYEARDLIERALIQSGQFPEGGIVHVTRQDGILRFRVERASGSQTRITPGFDSLDSLESFLRTNLHIDGDILPLSALNIEHIRIRTSPIRLSWLRHLDGILRRAR